jgi:hypothetical protein
MEVLMDINGIVDHRFIVIRDGVVVGQAPTESAIRDRGGRMSKFGQTVTLYKLEDRGSSFAWKEIATYSDGRITSGKWKAVGA